MRKDKVRSAGQRQIVKGQEPRESGMGAEGLRTMDASLGGASQRIQRDVCVLLNLALWSSLTPAYPHFFNENRIWIVPGIEEVWVFFPSEWRKRKRKDGGKESRRAVPGPARGCHPLPLPTLAGAY